MSTPSMVQDIDRSPQLIRSDTLVLTIGPSCPTDEFADTVESFGEATQAACRYLVLDLSQVERINSDLLGLLLWAHGRLRMRGAELMLVRASRATREVLSRSGLDYVLHLTDDFPTATS